MRRSISPIDPARAAVGPVHEVRVHEVHHAGSTPIRTLPVGAERAATCNMQPPDTQAERIEGFEADEGPANSAEGHFSRSEQPPRTNESRRAEDAYRKVECKQRTRAERLRVAALLLEAMRAHGVSIGRLSAMVDVGEKQVRKWLSAETSIPHHVAMRMPREMRSTFLGAFLADVEGGATASASDRLLAQIKASGNIEAAHDLEDRARELAREMGRKSR